MSVVLKGFSSFERYGPYTAVTALKEASRRPLRSSLRVNLLKTTVGQLHVRSKERGWKLSPVPWCDEGFFVEAGDGETIGRDLLHRTGHFYIQEAASMLPVALLDPKPGEKILDLCAAPGSKTTQIASKMQGKGVVVANDVQEKRLWVLKSSLQRSGVTNAVVTKRVGQGFAKWTEQFDRVLCDAPCTAQGTSRKDSNALLKMNDAGIRKLAGIQWQLLEAAIHAAKIGGRIVYSTCTLTWEENEQLVLKILNKFSDQVSVLDAGLIINKEEIKIAREDSMELQKKLKLTSCPETFLRLWPHRMDTEGFFCAVLEKKASTRDQVPLKPVPFLERPLSSRDRDRFGRGLTEEFGASFLEEGEVLFTTADQISVVSPEAASFLLPFTNYALGLPFGRIRGERMRLSHELVILRGLQATKKIHTIPDGDFPLLFRGQEIPCSPDFRGDVILTHDGLPLGVGMAKSGRVRHRFPKYS